MLDTKVIPQTLVSEVASASMGKTITIYLAQVMQACHPSLLQHHLRGPRA